MRTVTLSSHRPPAWVEKQESSSAFSASVCPEGWRPGASVPLPVAWLAWVPLFPVPRASVRVGPALFPAARTLSFSGSALQVRGGSGWLWEPLRGAGGGGPLGPGSQGGLRLLQFLCTLRLAGEMWFRAAGWAHRPSCGLDSEACHCHHMRPEVA